MTYCCFSTSTLSKVVEVNEELLDADTITSHDCLNPALDIVLSGQFAHIRLICAWVAVRCNGHMLDGVTKLHHWLLHRHLYYMF